MKHLPAASIGCTCAIAAIACCVALCRRDVPPAPEPESVKELELRTRLFSASNPNAGEEAVLRFRDSLEKSLPRHRAEQRVLLKEAEKNALEASDGEIERILRPLANAAGALTAQERGEMRDMARREVLCGKAMRLLTDRLAAEVTDEEIGELSARAEKLAALSAATNELVYARATNVWKRIAAGEDFAALAGKFSEAMEAPDCEWGVFPLDSFADSPELAGVLAAMSPGDVSPPVEGDNGLMILKVKSMKDECGRKSLDLERIFFKLAEEVPSFSTAELRHAIAGRKARERIMER